MWLQRHPFHPPPVEKETTSILHPLPVISQSRNRHPLPFFERVITRDTMHANPDILDGNAISGRWEGRGQIPRWWIRLKNGLLEGDPEHPAKRIDDGAPHSPGASLLWFSHYRRRLDAPAPPFEFEFGLFSHRPASLISPRPTWSHATTRVSPLPSLRIGWPFSLLFLPLVRGNYTLRRLFPRCWFPIIGGKLCFPTTRMAIGSGDSIL